MSNPDRGKIAIAAHPNSKHWYPWEKLEQHERDWWNCVFDAVKMYVDTENKLIGDNKNG
jgi:hypothetical protein